MSLQTGPLKEGLPVKGRLRGWFLSSSSYFSSLETLSSLTVVVDFLIFFLRSVFVSEPFFSSSRAVVSGLTADWGG